jgi:hypothetical protein
MLRLLSVTCFCPLICLVYVTRSTATSLDHDDDLVDWLNSRNDGYFNPKQEIRRVDSNDPTSMRGIFAKERIEKGELLCHVPWDSLITSYENGREYDVENDEDLSCGTVRNLVREMQLGEKSELAPYISYLQAQQKGQIPNAWSEAGLEFFREILGGDEDEQTIPPYSPFQWLGDLWLDECDGNPNDSQAAMLVVQRADEDILVPVYDMYNHRNGKWLNTIVERTHGIHHQTRASRTIEAGDQIYNSYNLCRQCGSRHKNFGTPGKLGQALL